MRTSYCAFAVLALIGLAADAALCHGGGYNGPAGGGTPSFGGPHGNGSGNGHGGPTGGAGTGGTTGGSGFGLGGSTPPGGGGAPPRPGIGGGGGGSRIGGATPRSKPRNSDDLSQGWDWWWALNDDQYLQVKAAIRRNEIATNEGDDIFGRNDGDITKVTASQIRRDVLPVVRLGLADPFYDAKAGAVIAAGKIVDRTFAEHTEVLKSMKALLADDNQQVKESACLGLGLLGDRESVRDLVAIMQNTVEARAKLAGQGTKDVPTRQRAFAAIAVGMIGSQDPLDASVVSELVAQMNKDDAHVDLQVFPALALGVMRSQGAVPELKKLAENLEADEIVRAHAVIARAKLGDKSSVGWLVKDGLTDKSTHVQRSSAIALGLLTDKEDAKTVETLMSFAKSAADRAVRNFCLIALGQIGSPKGRDFLVMQLKGGQQHDRTFSALALGVYGARSRDSRTELGNELLAKWKETRSDSERGAYAIGMGLLGHKAGADALMDELKAGGSPDLKGHVATALGLMGHRQAIPLIQDLAKRTSDLDAQRRASIALGLVGDADAVKLLTKVIEDAGDNLSALGGAAVALGFIGDRAAVSTLGDILAKRDAFKDNARAFAAVALGILGDKSELPQLSKVQENCNYLATTEGLNEILLIY
jgi:HEAT repeat protein